MRLASFLIPSLLIAVASCGSAGSSPGTTPSAAGSGGLSNRSGAPGDQAALEARIRRLEEQLAKYAEALEFLGKVYDQQKAQQELQDRQTPDPDAMFAIDISRDIIAGKVDGPKRAPITLISVFDFACPYCHRMSPVIEEIVTESKGKVRVVYMDLVIHPQVVTTAHRAACAAAKQGKYKQFRNAVWDQSFVPYTESRDASKFDEASLLAIAKGLRLDTKQLAADMHGAACRKLIEDDMQELSKFGVVGTPTLFVNGRIVSGAISKATLKQMVDDQLAIVDASGLGADYYEKVVLVKGEKQFKSAAD